MRVRVLAFARVRELLDGRELALELDDGARIGEAWTALLRDFPSLDDVGATIRIARNGRIATLGEALSDGDELALLPPVSGG